MNSLAQYYDAAQYLLRRAQRDPVFRCLSVGEVPYALFGESSISAEPCSVVSGLITRSTNRQQKRHSDAVPTKLEATLRISRAKIVSRIHTHAVKSKRVHAEVQLLLYYEVNNHLLLPPRVIYSNKHTCLLCNLFIKAHGRFHIRSCHGRLYPRWRVPLLQGLKLSESSTVRIQQAIDELNRQLEMRTKQCLEQARLRISDPQESIVFVPGAYTPSMLSAATAPETAVDMATMPIIDCSHHNSTSSIPKRILPTLKEQFYLLDYGHTIETCVSRTFLFESTLHVFTWN